MKNKNKLILAVAITLTVMAGTWTLISNNSSAPTSQNQKSPVTINDPISDAMKQVDEQARSSTSTPAQTPTNKSSSPAVTAQLQISRLLFSSPRRRYHRPKLQRNRRYSHAQIIVGRPLLVPAMQQSQMKTPDIPEQCQQ